MKRTRRLAVGGAAAVMFVAALMIVPGIRAGRTPHTIFWVFAHPDDETLAAGGALQEAEDRGDHNIVVILADGAATGVARTLPLSTAELVRAREAEARAALRAIGIQDVRFLKLPDGKLSITSVEKVLTDLASQYSDDPIEFRGHSPFDEYPDLPCGHRDHCTVGRALMFVYTGGTIPKPTLYRMGHLFGGPEKGSCTDLSGRLHAAKRRMFEAYALEDPAKGRYGIAVKSVPGAWQRMLTARECIDRV